MKKQRPLYIAHTQPGFEAIAADEISLFEDAVIRETRIMADKNGLVFFEYPHDIRELFELRTVEDLFEVIFTLRDLPPVYSALDLLKDAAKKATTIEGALGRARLLKPNRGGQGKLRYRVVARQVGETRFRRVDAQVAVEKGIAARPDHRWRLEEEQALEFWLTLLPGEAILALRLSDERMRHREYKLEHLPASLRPSAAAALVFLTQPEDDDVFLDPMCGAGTLLIERAHAGRYQQLLGGDISPQALEIARANIGPRYKPVELHKWDARSLPIEAGSVSALAVNLPFGRQIGSPEENRALYPAFLREAVRVLRPGARMVALTGDARTFDEALRRANSLRGRGGYPVQLLGRRARIFVIERV